MENLNAEQVINELDCQTRFAKFSNSNGVLISVKCAQFVLDHAQYYEQMIKELEAENERLKAQKYYIHSDGRIEMIPTVESVRADTIDEFVKMTKEKMREVATGKRTSLIGTGWIDEIARELKGE